jgi:O-antigen/teichoic acid export membrane protein
MQAVHGAKWSGVSTISVTILMYARLIVLAHLLSPKDFGLMGMVMVIIGLGAVFADMGISNAIIWKQDVTSEQLSTLYWINMMAGLAVFCIAIAVSPLVAAFFHEPRLVQLIFWAAFIFPITAIGQQFQILLQKELRFRRLAAVEIVAASVNAVVAITAAFLHQGVYSLIWGQVAAAACMALILAYIGWREWRPRLSFKPRNLDGMLSFGFNQMGQRVMDSITFNIDYIMVGHFLGPKLLGAYIIAWQLMIAPMSKLNPVLTRVAFPVFARKQTDDSALRRGYKELSKMVATLTFPLIVLAGATAPILIPTVFGSKWKAAIPLIQIFVILGLFWSLASLFWPMALAKGRADIGFRLSVALATVCVIAFWFAAQNGLTVIAWTEAIVATLLFLVVLLILRSIIGLELFDYVKEVGKPTLLTLAAGGITYACYHVLRGVSVSPWWLLAVLLALGVLCCALLIAVFERTYFLYYFWLFLGRETGGPPRPTRKKDGMLE